ncbi:MAG: YceI family protein [Bacteroidota bacterium]
MSTTKWVLDPTHSEVQFKVKHLMISTVTGHFKTFEATAETEGDDFSSVSVTFSAELESISTNNDQRDAHLKSPDFFDLENHPKLSFTGSSPVKTGEGTYKLTGDLTLRGVTKPLTLDVELGGFGKDPWGNERFGVEVTGKINRKDFGVNFSMVNETGGILLSEVVTLHAAAEFVKQA